MFNKTRIAFVAAACLVLPGAATIAAAQSAMPAMRGEGAARYVCGGIGSDESTAFRAAMKEHPLALLFARADGAYEADVAVSIQNENNVTALAFRANGPVCLIDLPAGKYVVNADAGSASKKQAVTVGGGSKSVDFRF
ncbi:MAG: carboxypeptidase regulatory-like domain-containing protein [Variovorax sp.]|nr:carboxypeptidase regulatory-like domain-containing protein [Variovorax sp.]